MGEIGESIEPMGFEIKNKKFERIGGFSVLYWLDLEGIGSRKRRNQSLFMNIFGLINAKSTLRFNFSLKKIKNNKTETFLWISSVPFSARLSMTSVIDITQLVKL